ncbi:NUDIX hydrolase [Flexivirga oryzae]|uniref:dATP pyrophosphohydrolase n=1 Tax=Flexivirga oryzae TaxID=1794944 RepID=A0A839N730_9MICO|nr:NUDIX domain-containing protein [Flexivirga oryzae]MBB2891834.1 dATP pyrophosphohydrolase [Flexivirga oryzae]
MAKLVYVVRAPIQVVVIPFRRLSAGSHEFALFQRSDNSKWQPVAGGAEDDESPAQAARREAHEEAGTPIDAPLLPLQTMDTVPVHLFRDRQYWPADLYVVPQHVFAIDATELRLAISAEHLRLAWRPYAEARRLLAYQSNETALWELNERLTNDDLPSSC